MRKALVCGFCLFAVIGGLFGQQQAAMIPDEIFVNGKIITVDSALTIQEAFAVRNDRFLAIGSTAAIRALAGPQTRLTDLRGHAVIPGLMDNHIHPWRALFGNLKGIDLTGVHSVKEIGDRIRHGAATAKAGRNIYATGRWSETDLSEKRVPTRAELDQIVPERPLMILQARQKAYLNSAALKAAGISRDTKAVYGEPLPKDASGEPTGVLTNAWAIMTVGANLIPIDDIRELSLQTQQDLNAQGFTSIREPMVPNPIMRMYSNLRREGKLTLRIAMGLDVGAQQADELDDILSPLGVTPTFGDHWLRLDSVGEYAIDGNTSTNPTPEMFRRGVMTMHRYGWRPAPHTTSDKALDIVLDTYEGADRVKPIGNERWVVEHIPMVRTDQLDRLAKLGIVVSAQFQPYRGSENMIKTYGRERAERAVPMREMLDHHLIVNAGSDWGGGPVTNPFIPIYFYVTRKTEDGTLLGAAQKISREEALRVSTINTAYLTFEEDVKGSIEAGKLADFLILSQDILTVPDEQIRSIQPLATYVGGQKVFSRKDGGY
jgi:predicted amidohydrolase YtcJ